MNLGKYAEATHREWRLPYVMGARLMVRRVEANMIGPHSAQTQYVAVRCKKSGRTWCEAVLGPCDSRGYPISPDQLQMC